MNPLFPVQSSSISNVGLIKESTTDQFKVTEHKEASTEKKKRKIKKIKTLLKKTLTTQKHVNDSSLSLHFDYDYLKGKSLIALEQQIHHDLDKRGFYYLINQAGVKKHLISKETKQTDLHVIQDKINKALNALPAETKNLYIKNNALENQSEEIWKELLIHLLYAASQDPLNQLALELDRTQSPYMLTETNFSVTFYVTKDQIRTQQIAYATLKSPQEIQKSKKTQSPKVVIQVEADYLMNKNKITIDMKPDSKQDF